MRTGFVWTICHCIDITAPPPSLLPAPKKPSETPEEQKTDSDHSQPPPVSRRAVTHDVVRLCGWVRNVARKHTGTGSNWCNLFILRLGNRCCATQCTHLCNYFRNGNSASGPAWLWASWILGNSLCASDFLPEFGPVKNSQTAIFRVGTLRGCTMTK